MGSLHRERDRKPRERQTEREVRSKRGISKKSRERDRHTGRFRERLYLDENEPLDRQTDGQTYKY